MKLLLIFLFAFNAQHCFGQQRIQKNTQQIIQKKATIKLTTDEELIKKLIKDCKIKLGRKNPKYEIDANEIKETLEGIDTSKIISLSIKTMDSKTAVKKWGTQADGGLILIKLKKIENETQAGNLELESPPPPRVEKEITFDKNKIYDKVETVAYYIGSWKNLLLKNLKYPDTAQILNIQGNVIINFIVETDGKINNLKVSDISPQKNEFLVNEAIRVIKKTNGQWKPAIQNGNKVRSIKEQSILFAFAEE